MDADNIILHTTVQIKEEAIYLRFSGNEDVLKMLRDYPHIFHSSSGGVATQHGYKIDGVTIGFSINSKYARNPNHIDGCLCYWCGLKEASKAHLHDCMCYKCFERRQQASDPSWRLENVTHDEATALRDMFPEDSPYWWQWQCLIHHLSATHYREQMVKAQDELALIRRLNQQRKEEAATNETETANSLQAELDAARRDVQLYQGNALYWKAQYDQAVAEKIEDERDPLDIMEISKLRTTVAVLANMLAGAYDHE